jgi:hypothetical protein
LAASLDSWQVGFGIHAQAVPKNSLHRPGAARRPVYFTV